MTETCDVDGCDDEAVLVDDKGASCETHICAVGDCDDHVVGETDEIPVCDDHMALATADLLDHVDTWGDGDEWGLRA
jgi:hypothetical protein